MALARVMYNFAVRLADADRSVYEDVTLRTVRHPSETDGRILPRAGNCLE